jgi:PAS domain S-box-containing protein
MQVFTSALVLGICITAFVLINIKDFKDRKVISSTAIAKLISFNSASALAFLDNSAAEQILSELQVQNDIINAVILDNKGNTFASYTKPGADSTYNFTVPNMNQNKSIFTRQYLFIYNNIKKNNEIIGVVCLRSELTELKTIKMEILTLGIILLFVGLCLAILIAIIIKKYISTPLISLVEVIKTIKESADYKIRMLVKGNDEIGVLATGFNDMLENIEKRDRDAIISKEQLSEQNILLASVIKNMGDGLVVSGVDGRFILWNPASEKMIGIGLLDIPEEKWSSTYGIYWPDTEKLMDTNDLPFVKALSGVDITEMEMYVKNYQKTEGASLIVSARALRDFNGTITGAVAVIHDITERKKSETLIKKLNTDLEKKVTERTTQLAAALETLRASEEKYREIVENTSDVVHTTDHLGNFTYINPACKKLTGFTEKELMGTNISDLISPEWRERVNHFFLNQFKSMIDETHYSFPIITKSREQKWIEQTVRPLREGNRITGHKSIMRDITVRYTTEQKLKASEGQLQTIFNEAPDALIVIDDQRSIIRWNPKAQEMFGWSLDEVLGEPIGDLFIPEQHRENITKVFDNFIATGQSPIMHKTIEITALKKNGVEFDIAFTVSPATIKGRYIFIAFIKDISISKQLQNEKTEAERLVRQSELKLKLILENIGEGIVVTDTQKRIVLSNHMAEEIIGIKKDTETPTTLDWSAKYSLYYPDEKTIFPAQNLPLDKALKGESTSDVELIIENFETKDKKRVLISGRPIVDEDNMVIAAVANIKDITSYKQLEAALEESEKKIRKLIGFKSDEK